MQILITYIHRNRRATKSYHSKFSIPLLNISATHGVEINIVHEQIMHQSSIINLHYRFILFALYYKLQKCWSLHFQLLPSHNILAIHNDVKEQKTKEIRALEGLERIRIFKNEICNNPTYHLNNYQLKDLLYLYTKIFIGNNLLKYPFFILQQIRDKLIISFVGGVIIKFLDNLIFQNCA